MTKELFWLYIVPTLGLLVVDTVFIYKEAKQGAVLSHCWKLLVVDLIPVFNFFMFFLYIQESLIRFCIWYEKKFEKIELRNKKNN